MTNIITPEPKSSYRFDQSQTEIKRPASMNPLDLAKLELHKSETPTRVVDRNTKEQPTSE